MSKNRNLFATIYKGDENDSRNINSRRRARGNFLARYACRCLFILLFLTSLFGQDTTNETGADRTLRGSGRVNASTLGMEFDLSLGGYPGRGINVPVNLSYSSKLWRMEYTGHATVPGGNYSTCKPYNEAVFGENSASGWTTSLAVPYIEYVGKKNIYFDNGKGGANSEINCPVTNEDPQNNNYAYIRRLLIHLPSGETHELRPDDTPIVYSRSSNSCPSNTTCDPNDPNLPANWNAVYYAADSSNIKYIQNSVTGVYRLLMPDGSSYEFAATTEQLNFTEIRKAAKFTDRNGNYTTYYGPGSVDNNNVTHPNGYWKDTMGRNIPIPLTLQAPTAPTTAQSPQVYSLPGMNSTSVTYKFHWKKLKDTTAAESGLTDFSQNLRYYSATYGCNNPNPTLCTRPAGTSLFQGNLDSVILSTDIFNPVVLTEIELPTGQKYKFTYDVYGRIERIYYPTGGEERFEYETFPTLSVLEIGDVNGQTNFGVKKRKVYQTAGQGTPYEWTYNAEYAAPSGYKVSITAPNGILSERFLHRGKDPCSSCTIGDFGYDNGLAGMPYEERVFSSADNIVSRKLTHWTKSSFSIPDSNSFADWHPRVAHEESFVYDAAGNAVSATVKYEYEGNLSLLETPVLVNKTTQYAFVPIQSSSSLGGGDSLAPGDLPDTEPTPVPTPVPSSSPVKIVESTYLINDTVNYPNQTDRDAYKNRNMVGLITVSKIKDGAGTIVSQTENRYDETGSYPIISAATSAANWTDPATNYRGNPTTSKVWDSTKGAVTNSSAYIATHAQFDNFGNQRKVWDAKGNLTETDYTSPQGQDYKFAFPTKVTSATPDPNPSQNPDQAAHGSPTAFETTVTYDPVTGLVLTTTNVNGLEARIEYDSTTLRPLNAKTFYQNQQVGSQSETVYHDELNNYWIKNRAKIDASNWAESITYFDGLGRAYKTETIDAQGNIFVEKEFDADGRALRVSSPFKTNETKKWTTSVYDDASRVIEVVLPDGAKVKTDYGVSISGTVGITKQITDQASQKRKGVTDALGRMIEVIEDPAGQNLSTTYVFDTLGNLRKTTQGVQERYFSYDSLGRLLRAKQPEQEANTNLALASADSITNHNQWSVKYEYDDNGNISKLTDAKGVYVEGTYDKLNRLIYRNYSDSTPDVSFYYDGAGLSSVPAYSKGKATKVSSSVSETRYTSFDNMGRLLTSEQLTTAAQRAGTETPYTSTYTYNLSGALISETYPSGRVVTNNYNQDGEVESVWGTKANQTSAKLYLSDITQNSAGSIVKMRLGNGRWETAEYNERQQITKIGLGYSDTDKSLLNLEYDYGTNLQNNGSLRQQKISYAGLSNQITQDYTYDSLNRLQSATETAAGSQTPTWKQTFDYDRYGNRTFNAGNTTTLSQNASSKITNPIINTSDNRLKKDQDNDTVTDYDYDKNGNLTLDAENKRFVYDAENRQTQFFAATNNTQTPDATYYYDGEGRRVRKISGQIETIFVYNASAQLIAEYSNELPATPKISYLTSDHLGSPRIITDEGGRIVSRHDYRAFGDEIQAGVANRTTAQGYNSDDEIRKQYTGYERDEESGLDFAQARYYNSQHGRFTSVDPLTASASIKNPQTFNRYSYVLNSPYKFTDPLGLISVNTNACGMSCRNSGPYSTGEGMSSWSAGDPFYVTVEILHQSQHPLEPPPQPLLGSDDGTIDASDITPTVADYDRTRTTDGSELLFDSELTREATKVAATVEQNDVAYLKNKENWKKETKAFNDVVDNKSSLEVRDMADLGGERDIGTVNSDGTIAGVPAEHTGGGVSLNFPIGGSGDTITTYNTLGVASANKANAQIKLLNEMESSTSVQRAAFIRANAGRTVTVQTNGRVIGKMKLGSRNAGVIYDNAVKMGFAAAARHFIRN